MSLLDDLRQVAERLDEAAKPIIAEVSDVVGAIVHTLEAAGISAPDAASVPSTPPPEPGTPAGPAEAAPVPPEAAPVPPEVAEVQQQLDAKQAQVAQVAGSEQAATAPASVHDQILALNDEIQSLQVKLADLQRAELTVENEPSPDEPPPAA